MKKNEIQVVENFNLGLVGKKAEVMKRTLSGIANLVTNNVKFPSGGSLIFELPSEDESNPEFTKELIGVIIDQFPVNSFWVGEYDGSKEAPLCMSIGAVQGFNSMTGEMVQCATCEYNQYGTSVKGKGKACKNMFRIYFLQENSLLPIIIDIPPTSLRNIANYLFKGIVEKGYECYEVVTEISLKKAVNKEGIEYSQAVFRNVGKLPEEQAARLKMISEQYSKNRETIAPVVDVAKSDFVVEDSKDDSKAKERKEATKNKTSA